MWRTLLLTCAALGLTAGQAEAKDRYQWDYSEAGTGTLSLKDLDIPVPMYRALDLTCDSYGDLLVTARNLILWNDVSVSAADPADLQTLAVETETFRIETELEEARSNHDAWAGGRFAGAAAFARGITGSSLLVVRAISRVPVAERADGEWDLIEVYPAIDYLKSEPFRGYCAKVAAPAP